MAKPKGSKAAATPARLLASGLKACLNSICPQQLGRMMAGLHVTQPLPPAPMAAGALTAPAPSVTPAAVDCVAPPARLAAPAAAACADPPAPSAALATAACRHGAVAVDMELSSPAPTVLVAIAATVLAATTAAAAAERQGSAAAAADLAPLAEQPLQAQQLGRHSNAAAPKQLTPDKQPSCWPFGSNQVWPEVHSRPSPTYDSYVRSPARLVVVVDTCCLLRPQGLALLRALSALCRPCSGTHCQQVEVVMVVPQAVKRELKKHMMGGWWMGMSASAVWRQG